MFVILPTSAAQLGYHASGVGHKGCRLHRWELLVAIFGRRGDKAILALISGDLVNSGEPGDSINLIGAPAHRSGWMLVDKITSFPDLMPVQRAYEFQMHLAFGQHCFHLLWVHFVVMYAEIPKIEGSTRR